MNKIKIPKLSYNSMFKAVMSNNPNLLKLFVEAIISYCKMDIDIKDNDLVIKSNELSLNNYNGKQLICDYIIKLNDNVDLNIEVNRVDYIGLIERNLIYTFNIYYSHFKSGDKNNDFKKV